MIPRTAVAGQKAPRLTQPQRLRAQLRYPQPSAHTPPTPELNDQRLRAQLRHPQPSAHTPSWSPPPLPVSHVDDTRDPDATKIPCPLVWRHSGQESLRDAARRFALVTGLRPSTLHLANGSALGAL
jgi:hypothetical protein